LKIGLSPPAPEVIFFVVGKIYFFSEPSVRFVYASAIGNVNLKNLSDVELLKSTKAAAFREREATLILLHHLREVERRFLYAHQYSSLHAYCVGELGLDGAMAQSRISAMRLLRDFPEFTEETQSGKLNLTLLAQAHSFFHKEKISSQDEKREIIRSVCGKSVREAERELISRASIPELHVPERVRPVSRTHTELRFLVDEEIMGYIETLKGHLLEWKIQEIFRTVLKEAVEKRQANPLPKPIPKKDDSLPAQEVKRSKSKRSSKAKIRREVFARDQNQCTFTTSDGKRCEAKTRLEVDHILPKSKFGLFTADNLRLLCRTHNQLAAVQEFGLEKMAQFLPKLRDGP